MALYLKARGRSVRRVWVYSLSLEGEGQGEGEISAPVQREPELPPLALAQPASR